MKMNQFLVSTLERIFLNRATGMHQLAMAEITGYDELASFGELRNYVMGLRYPTPQSNKLETYGWVPTVFQPTIRAIRGRDGVEFDRKGCWRSGEAEAEADGLSVFYADVDNANPNEPVVTMTEVASRLNVLGGPLNFFMYTSFSDTPQKPKFRVVIETDRDISRAEMLRLGLYLNWHAFGHQADLSIYDPGDFVFAPPFQTTSLDQLTGVPLDVDAILASQAALQESAPQSVLGYVAARQPQKPKKSPTQPQIQVMTAKIADQSVRACITVANRDVFNPLWSDFYRERCFWTTAWAA